MLNPAAFTHYSYALRDARPGLAGLYRRRLPTHTEVATLTVPTDGRRPEAITEDVLIRLARVPAADGRTPSSRPAL